jgi:hypothetical protein
MPFIPLETPHKATDPAFPRVSADTQTARDADAEDLVRQEFSQRMPAASRAALETEYRQRFNKEPPQVRRGFIPLADSGESEQRRGFVPLEPERPSMLKLLALENPATAIGETALNLASQAVALPVAGLAGLAAEAGNALGLTDRTGADVVHSVGEKLTYQPRGEMGKAATEIATYPFQKLAEAGQYAGDKTLEATGSPLAATAVDTFIQGVLPMAAGPAVKAGKAGVAKVREGIAARKGFTPIDEAGSSAHGIETRAQRVASDDPAMRGAEPQGLSALRSEGDNGLPGMAGELRQVPDGHGAGAEPVALAGQAGRAGELRANELPLDDAARAGEAPRVLQEGLDWRAADDGSGGRALAGTADKEFSIAPNGARPSPGRASGETVPGVDLADAQRRDPAFARNGEAARGEENASMAPTESGLAARSGIDPATPATKGARYALIEADNLKPSHNTELRAAKDYPETFNRSDWNRADAEQRIQGIVGEFDPARLAESIDDASGAPIVARDGIVEAGNARSIALKRVYQANGAKAETYRQHLKANAGRLGLDPAAVDQMKKPVLVRVPDEPAPRAVQAKADDVQHSFAPGANYAPMIDDASAPVAVDSVVGRGKPIRREDIIIPFAKDLGASIYTGRVNMKNALGYFRRGNEEVRIRKHADLETTAHEMGHLIDSRVPAISNEWRSNKALRQELKSISYDQQKVSEGYAEGIRLYLTQPEVLQSKAPMVFDWLENFTKTDKRYGPVLSKAQAGMTKWFAQDALDRARSKIGDHSPLSDAMNGIFENFRQSTVDDLHGIYRMERDLKGGKIEPNGAYESARLSRASASIADGAIRYGYPVKNADGSFSYRGKGLEAILKPVADRMDDAMLYFVGRSANELMTQGREHLFTKGEIRGMLQLETPEFRKAFAEYQAFNKGVLDFAEAQGILNPEARRLWKRTEYLPFHRVQQPGGLKGKPGDWAGIQQLTGGTENIRDVLGNMVGNTAMLIDKAVKNEARVKVANLAQNNLGGKFMVKIDTGSRPVKIGGDQVLNAMFEKYGIAVDGDAPAFFEFLIHGQPPAGSNVVAVMKGGKPVWYEVADPLLFRSLQAIDRPPMAWLTKWLGMPKRIGQMAITLTPDFMIANIARDTIMGSVMSRSGFRPVVDSLKGMRLRMTEDPIYKDYIANGGGLSSLYLDENHLRTKLEKFYSKQGIDYRTVLDSPDKLLSFVETLADSFEVSTRMGEYSQAIKAGDHPRHAAYKGREVSTDFAMRGDSKALGFMYDTVMFLRPAVVSMDRLYRGVAHDPNKAAIGAKTAMIALSSVGLYMLNREDPRYADLPDWDRDANWHFFVGDKHFRYPKIWEVGAVASLAERTTEKLMQENPEGLGTDYARIIGHTFNLNFMPQIVAPLYEQATNRNNFTKAPIETPGMENVQPFMRAKPSTSETMKALGMATRNLPESMQVNPVRGEALLRGYLNTWAMYGLMLSDKAFFGDKLPAMRTDQMPVVRRFYAEEPPLHTKFETQFYDMLGEAKRLQGTMRELDKQGRPEIADEKEAERMAGEAKPLERAGKNLQGINKDMLVVRRDATLSPEEKRQRLDQLTVERNALLKAAVQDTEAALKEKKQ